MSAAVNDKDFAEEDLPDYEVGEEVDGDEAAAASEKPADAGEAKKGSYVGIHSSGFKDFLLKPELLRAISDCGFEHPSEGEQAEPTWHGGMPVQAVAGPVAYICDLRLLNIVQHESSRVGHRRDLSGKVR